jgi:hypothetical protein
MDQKISKYQCESKCLIVKRFGGLCSTECDYRNPVIPHKHICKTCGLEEDYNGMVILHNEEYEVKKDGSTD